MLLAGNVMEPPSIIIIITVSSLFRVGDEAGDRPDPLRHLDCSEYAGGLCHPPVGLNPYVASSIAKMGIAELTIAVRAVAFDDAGSSRWSRPTFHRSRCGCRSSSA
jgi:C4-dicarboxylate transporter DctM subunit